MRRRLLWWFTPGAIASAPAAAASAPGEAMHEHDLKPVRFVEELLEVSSLLGGGTVKGISVWLECSCGQREIRGCPRATLEEARWLYHADEPERPSPSTPIPDVILRGFEDVS